MIFLPFVFNGSKPKFFTTKNQKKYQKFLASADKLEKPPKVRIVSNSFGSLRVTMLTLLQPLGVFNVGHGSVGAGEACLFFNVVSVGFAGEARRKCQELANTPILFVG